jgi:hypothetical protein
MPAFMLKSTMGGGGKQMPAFLLKSAIGGGKADASFPAEEY